MGIFDWFKKGKRPAEQPAPQAECPQELEAAIDVFRRETMSPCVKLQAVRGETTRYSSKFGGAPYLPGGFAYPRSTNPHSAGRPLRLLAQLNFAELPALPEFPHEGILQIYAEPDDLYGADFDNLTEQAGYRVVYHPAVDSDPAHLEQPPAEQPEGEDLFPFSGEFALTAELSEMPMSSADYRFDQAFLEVYRRFLPTDAQRVWDLDTAQYERIMDAFQTTGHHIGGSPFFTQEDPRGYRGELAGHTTLLLQIDSCGRGEDEILWGDCGVAGFFITPEHLEKRDFSQVLYNWDCY